MHTTTKKTTTGTRTGLLSRQKKDIRQQAQQTRKELDINEITSDLINETSQITILKNWAKKLGVPNLVSYKVANIAALKRAMLAKLTTVKENEEPIVDVVEKDDENELYKQYVAIEKFLKSYSKNPSKTTSIYGQAGEKFNDMWKHMTRNEKAIFIGDYFQLNVEPKKVNPVSYLHDFIESRKGVHADTQESVTAAYLREFIKNIANPTEESLNAEKKLVEHVLFPKTFLTKFTQLEQPVQIKFAGQYIRSSYRNPLDALELFLNPQVTEEKKISPVQILRIGGMGRIGSTTEPSKPNNYTQCVNRFRNLGWIIRPISNVDQIYISAPASIIASAPSSNSPSVESVEWYHPSDALYTDICQYQTYVKSPLENILILNSNKKVVFEVKSTLKKDYSPSSLATDLQSSQSGSIFTKLPPAWILNTPLYQVDQVYIDAPSLNISVQTKMNLEVIIQWIQKESRFDTYQTYLLRFLVTFFPFMRNVAPKEPHVFYIVDKLKSGYITQDSYKEMAISEKAPEADIKLLVEDLEKYLPIFAFETIRTVNSGNSGFVPTPITFRKDTFREISCPEADIWKAQDLVIYNDKCLVIPELLTLFKNNNYTDPKTGEELDKFFVEDIKRRYSHLTSEKFENKSGEYFVDKALYDKTHPVVVRPVRKDKYTPEDLSSDFDKYFNLKKIILDPVALIKNIMEFDIMAHCVKCGCCVSNSGVKSILNRTDGTIIQVSFCNYKCMAEHDFIPLHTADEEIEQESPNFMASIVDSV